MTSVGAGDADLQRGAAGADEAQRLAGDAPEGPLVSQGDQKSAHLIHGFQRTRQCAAALIFIEPLAAFVQQIPQPASCDRKVLSNLSSVFEALVGVSIL